MAEIYYESTPAISYKKANVTATSTEVTPQGKAFQNGKVFPNPHASNMHAQKIAPSIETIVNEFLAMLKEHAELKEKHEQRGHALRTVEQKLHDTQNTLHKTEVHVRDLKKEISRTNEKLGRLGKDLHHTQEKLHDTQETLHKAEVRIHDLKKELAETVKQLEEAEELGAEGAEKRKQLGRDLNNVQEKLHNTQDELHKAQTRIHERKEDIKKLNSEISETKVAFDQMLKHDAQDHAKIDGLETDLKKSQANDAADAAEIADLQKENKSLNESDNKHRTQLTNQQKELEDLDRDRDAARGELKALKAQNKAQGKN